MSRLLRSGATRGHIVKVYDDKVVVDGRVLPSEALGSTEGPLSLPDSIFGVKAIVGENKIAIRGKSVTINRKKYDLSLLPYDEVSEADTQEYEEMVRKYVELDKQQREKAAPRGEIISRAPFSKIVDTRVIEDGKVIGGNVKVNGKVVEGSNSQPGSDEE